MTDKKQGPDTTGVVHERQKGAVTIVRDVLGGTARMREARGLYLPQFPREENDAYAARLSTAVLFNALRQTVLGLTGMILRKPPELGEDTPEDILQHLENVDLQGRDFVTFTGDHMEDAMADGHAHIFVDQQAVDPGSITNLEELRKAELRPNWITLRKDQILRFRTINVAGRTVLSLFAYIDTTVEADGDFGEKELRRVRQYKLVLDPETQQTAVQFRVWIERRGDAGRKEWKDETPTNNIMGIPEIPLTTTYTGRVGFMESEPPLLGLAYENIRHWQLRSDRDNTLHIAGTPIPVFMGLEVDENGEVVGGTGNGIILPIEGNAKYLEPEGVALEETRTELSETDRRMAVDGLSMLMSETRSAETATSKRIDKSESDSRLTQAALGLEASLTEALRFHGMWMGLQDFEPTVTVNLDFIPEPLDPQMVTALSAMVMAGNLSVETMWEMLVRGELLPADFDPEMEKERIDNGDVNQLKALAASLPPDGPQDGAQDGAQDSNKGDEAA